MQTVSKVKYLRIAPRKVRLVAQLLKGKKIEEAQNILNFISNKAALPFSKLLKQALSNAKNNLQLQEVNLFISKILVDEGPKMKRVFPRARGRAEQIQKKTSHITLVLEEIKKSEPGAEGKKKGKKGKVKKAKAELSSAKAEPSSDKAEPIKKEAEENIFKPELSSALTEKPKFRPETKVKKPTAAKGITRLFRRKSI